MAGVQALKVERAQLKSRVTRLNSYFNTMSELEINDDKIKQLKGRLETIKPILGDFYKVQGNIDLANDEEDSEELDNFETRYFDVISKIEVFIDKYNLSKTEPSPVNSNNSSNQQSQEIKLPAIKLITFSGRFDQWGEFKENFESLIHNNNDLAKTQKFYYLRSSLEGDAKQIIQSLDNTSENYSVAWELLLERYNNKKLIVHNHIKSIFELSTLHKECYKDLRALYDNMNKHLRSLKSLGEPVESWSSLLIYILCNKIDPITRREWEKFDTSSEIPNFEKFNTFLKHKCEILEKIDAKLDISKSHNNRFFSKYKNKDNFNTSYNKSSSFVNVKQKADNPISSFSFKCYFCQGSHSIYHCDALLQLKASSRMQAIRNNRLCVNCLKPGHPAQICIASGCKTCGRRHNSLLHVNNETVCSDNTDKQEKIQPSSSQDSSTVSSHAYNKSKCSNQILLSTAVVKIKDSNGKSNYARCLLDNGSQSNYITSTLCRKLNLKESPINYQIVGVGQATSKSTGKVHLEIASLNNSYKTEISCLILDKITNDLPVSTINKDSLTIPQDIRLADPDYYCSSAVELLLGVEVFYEVLMTGQYRLTEGPVLQNTSLGWILAGNLTMNVENNVVSSFLSIQDKENDKLNESLSKFWKIDEFNDKKVLSASEEFCEKHFVENTMRDKDGRFIVSIPLKDNIAQLGDSQEMAIKRFLNQEKKLQKNDELRVEYNRFLLEYITLGHMSEINLKNTSKNEMQYFMPHHSVIKESSTTTRVRVVFDASMKTNTDVSFNDVQHVGPTIQNDLFTILLRFRENRFVLTADISRMYRQVLINPDQRSLQRIVWRENPQNQIKCYELNTVTYGTAAAPFLAIRSLYQLGLDFEVEYPEACDIIKNNFYVDDCLFGTDSIQDLLRLKNELTSILTSGGFQLNKWLSNINLDNDTYVNSKQGNVLKFDKQETKTLGVIWNSVSDHIQYSVDYFATIDIITKRHILSITAQVFDPLGYLGPVMIIAKILIQKLWLSKVGWDEAIPQHLEIQWHSFKSSLQEVNEIKIPRHILTSSTLNIELHGFADASESAYGACVYVRCFDTSRNEYISKLLCAKSRVAPCKIITLPRLELCAAVLLSKLVKRVLESMTIKFERVCLYSDSTIVLGWIKGDPTRWKTFVANRVSEIQRITNTFHWYHIKSIDNPADILSRGVQAQTLLHSSLWWHGPLFLTTNNSNRIEPEINYQDIPEQRIICNSTVNIDYKDIFERYSNVNKLVRVYAYVIRFIGNLKLNKNNKKLGSLTVPELNNSLKTLTRLAQMESFPEDYHNLLHNKKISKKSSILSLDPFIDEDNLIRVGGRIQNSSCSYDKKHPIILHPKHIFTQKIVEREHKKLLHCGPTTLLASIRNRFWIVAGRNLVKKVTRNCVKCFRVNPQGFRYLMGNLPSFRVNRFSSFHNTGCDFAGPILIKDRNTRGAKLIKVYVCLFVCMSTKAVHLEVLCDLTTDCFLACLRRFIARRGKPANIYSDNGTTFVSANKQIRELSNFLKSESNKIIESMAEESITWHFIPARSPNFGGIWEAGIKRMKFHLHRIYANAHLNYEQFVTIIYQIEAIINSRPLCPLTSDPDNLEPLTPAHFLIGKSLVSVPEPCLNNIQENRLKIYQRLQKMVQHFWRRWQAEYISELQGRVKWKQNSANLAKVGRLVIVKEDNLPPYKWSLGRIRKVYPGKDNIVRVVDIKVKNSIVSRAISKICILPCEDI